MIALSINIPRLIDGEKDSNSAKHVVEEHAVGLRALQMWEKTTKCKSKRKNGL